MTQTQQITSIKDTRVVEARELTSAAGRARLGKTQLEGEESIRWALESGLSVEHVFYVANPRQSEIVEGQYYRAGDHASLRSRAAQSD